MVMMNYDDDGGIEAQHEYEAEDDDAGKDDIADEAESSTDDKYEY